MTMELDKPEADDVIGLEGATDVTALLSSSNEFERGLEQTLVFVLCDPWARGESMPESLGESNLR